MGQPRVKILSKENKIVEFKSSPPSQQIEIEFDYFEFDPDAMADSFFLNWNKYWMRQDQLNDDFYTT